MDYTDIECQKRLIKIFLNSVFIYDDKVVLTFNYSGDNRTITLKEIDAGLEQGVRLPRALSHQKQKTHPRAATNRDVIPQVVVRGIGDMEKSISPTAFYGIFAVIRT